MRIERALPVLAIAGALSGAACTVDRATPPALTGPSDLATSLKLTVNPDTVVMNGQQAVVTVEAHGAAGGPLANLRVHLDIAVEGALSTCGRLSLTDVTTATNDRASVVFTAPSLPLPLPACARAAAGVTIRARPVGTNAQAGTTFSAGVRFLAPSSSAASAVFAVNFSIFPNPGTVGTPLTFSDGGSVSPGHTISSYRWDWSDGATKIGSSVTHDFGSPGTYTVTLTITDDIGQSGSKTALVRINERDARVSFRESFEPAVGDTLAPAPDDRATRTVAAPDQRLVAVHVARANRPS